MTEPVKHDSSSGEYETKHDQDVTHYERDLEKQTSRRRSSTTGVDVRQNLNAKLANPLAGYSHAELEAMGEAYARKHAVGDDSDIAAFRAGAVCAQNPMRFDRVASLTDADKEIMSKEFSNRWSQPRLLYLVIVLCSTCAAVQGMDETVVNGAQLFYAKRMAECSPPAIRGALVMQWQMWTAFGIMLGYAADLAFYKVPDRPHITGLKSPRWYMSKNRHAKAYRSMCRLRFSKAQAARDVFYMSTLLEAESDMNLQRNKLLELVTVPRNRRAMLASEIVMFMQQLTSFKFCGVNIIAYYSSSIFKQAGYDDIAALSASLGWGIINFLFAIPAVYTIDTFGRRNLLLATFPFLSLFMFFTGFSFFIPETMKSARTGCIALGTYLFAVFYSPGEGPVPFTYSAEAYPLYVRSYGMSLATATTWFFNFILAVTFPSLVLAFTSQGAFSWYGAWNIVGWILVLLFVPETKGKTLEELDQVFGVPTRTHAMYGLKCVPIFFQKYLFRRNVDFPQLYQRDEEDDTSTGEKEINS
ncbi:MAG: hypothetical protein M1814_000957 [Vezdaea aestivalis]|nr:MAG: hypothetical protein M1814_000957 [Vezdaea aestivalis]